MKNFFNVNLRLSGVIKGKDAYLSYNSTSSSSHDREYVDASFVTLEYARKHKEETQIEWNLLYNEKYNGYLVVSAANGMMLTYNHKNNRNIVIKEYVEADVMSGMYFASMDYSPLQCIWTILHVDGGIVLQMNDNNGGSSLILTMGSSIESGYANAYVNTEHYFSAHKNSDYKILHMSSDIPFNKKKLEYDTMKSDY